MTVSSTRTIATLAKLCYIILHMTFGLTFYIDKNGRGIWTFPLTIRITLVFVAVVIGGSYVLFLAENNVSFFHLVLSLLAAAAATYNEKWIIDPKSRSVHFIINLLFIPLKQKKLAFDEIQGIQLINIISLKKPKQVKCQILTEEELIIESLPARFKQKLKTYAQQTAKLIGLSLEEITV